MGKREGAAHVALIAARPVEVGGTTHADDLSFLKGEIAAAGAVDLLRERQRLA